MEFFRISCAAERAVCYRDYSRAAAIPGAVRPDRNAVNLYGCGADVSQQRVWRGPDSEEGSYTN